MNYRLEDLIDISLFQNLLDKLNEIYPFPSAIIDNDGKILTATSWNPICTKFHRINPETEKECIISDKYILEHIGEANPAVSYRCPHGLVDNAIPIIIAGNHLANFFTGQFFLQPPDLDFFNQQAVKYGFDKASYLDAVRKTPVWNQDQLNKFVGFIQPFVNSMAEMGLTRLKEFENQKILEASEARYHTLVETAQDLIWQCDAEGRYIYLNPAWEEVFGYKLEEMLGKRFVDFQTPEYAQKDTREFKHLLKGDIVKGLETVHLGKDGRQIHLVFNAKQLVDEDGKPAGTQGTAYDITQRKKVESELLRHNQDLILINTINTAVNKGESMEGVIKLISDQVKGLFNSFGTTVNLVNSDRTRLVMQNLIIPARLAKSIEKIIGISLPRIEFDLQTDHPYHQVINSGKSQLINDIEGILEFTGGFILSLNVSAKTRARLAGMIPTIQKLIDRRSLMVVPLVINNVVIGTLDVGSQDLFSEADLLRLETIAGSLASVIQRKNAEAALTASDEKYHSLFISMTEGVAINELVMDEKANVVDYIILDVNPAFESNTPYKIKDVLGKRATEIYQMSPEFIQTWWQQHVGMGSTAFTELYHATTQRWHAITTTRPVGKRFYTIFSDITENKLAQQKLQESAGNMQAILDSNLDAVFLVEPNGTILAANRGLAESFGRNLDELIGSNNYDLVSKAVAENRRKLMDQVIASSQPLRFEDERSGMVIENSIYPVMDEHGKVVRLAIFGRDVSERKKAENKILRSESELKKAQSYAHVGSWVWNITAGKLEWSDEMYVIFGIPKENFTGNLEEVVANAIHPDDREKVEQSNLSVANEGKPIPLEYRILQPDGSQRVVWAEAGELELDSEGKPALLRGIVMDITERKQAEGEIRRMAQMLDVAPNSITVHDFEGRFIYANQMTFDLHGYTRDEFMTLTLHQIDVPESAELIAKRMQDIMAHGEATFEVGHYHKDGSILPLEVHARVTNWEDQKVLLSIATDIRERKRVEEEIRRRAEELDILQKTVLDITATQNLPGLLESIVERACQLLGAPAGGMYLNDTSKKEARCVVSYNTPSNYVGHVLKHGEGISGKVAQSGQMLNITQYQKWSGRAVSFDKERPFTAVLGVPLLWGGQVNGVIVILHYEEGRSFDQADQELATLFAGHAAIAIENSRLLEASLAGEAEVRKLSNRLAEAEENERRRIARELHDQVGQSLSALSINMNIMSSQIPPYLPGFKRRLDDSLMLIDQTTDHIRNLMSELRPAVLDDYGLKAALDWAAGAVASRTHLKVLVEGECNRFPARVEIALFRIAQEALGNITRHAGARNVKILLTQSGPDMSISITDDGKGFDPSAVAATEKSGWGLRLMAERAESIGASLQVESSPGQGTTITAKYHDKDSSGG